MLHQDITAEPTTFKRHRYPADVIRYAVGLYIRRGFSLKDVEERMRERGVEVSSEAIRGWTIKFAEQMERARPAPRSFASSEPRWRFDEMVCTVAGRRMYLWRAVAQDGQVLDLVLQVRRDAWSALVQLKRLLGQGYMDA
ncbi:DDE-type integrase/transposase/recombinase [Phenylobacterium immobile]|uniref:DDE-type integrase/transposase/recombinase n=1 Tax=Phenylobacterium immobile TaxID=21 RepID=UPI000A9BF2B3|nr:DDE-type integrase/transposase/recombinase [Phenylobacterium immobile]